MTSHGSSWNPDKGRNTKTTTSVYYIKSSCSQKQSHKTNCVFQNVCVCKVFPHTQGKGRKSQPKTNECCHLTGCVPIILGLLLTVTLIWHKFLMGLQQRFESSFTGPWSYLVNVIIGPMEKLHHAHLPKTSKRSLM